MGKKKDDEPNDRLPMPWENWGKKTRFGTGQSQPSSAAKLAGWARKKKNRELAQLILGMKFVGNISDRNGNLLPSLAKEKLMTYFGLTEKELSEQDFTNETMIMMRMVGQAIENGDVSSANAILERAYGKPKDFNDIVDDDGNRPVIQINVVNSLPGDVEMPPILESENPEQNGSETV